MVSIIILYYNIITLWDHPLLYGPLLPETSLFNAYLYIEFIEKQSDKSSKLMNEVTNPDDGNKHLRNVRNTSTKLYFVGERGGTVVKVLCYKSEGRWFDSRWCHWNFSLT